MTIDVSRAEAIKGWSCKAELEWLARRAQVCRRVVEVGVCCGRTSRAMGDHVLDVLFAVDPFDDFIGDLPLWQQVNVNLYDLIASGKVRLVRERSPKAAERLKVEAPFDLVFIDGDHSYEAVKADIHAWLPLLRSGGMIAGHDHNDLPQHEGVKRAVDEILPKREKFGSIWWWRP